MTNFTLLYKKSGLKSLWKLLKNRDYFYELSNVMSKQG